MSEDEEQEWDKDIGQFRLALNDLFRPLRRYGQDIYVDGVMAEVVNLAWQLHWRLVGVDMPYEVEHNVRW